MTVGATYLVPAVTLPIDAPVEEAFAVAAARLRKLGFSPARCRFSLYRRSVDARRRDRICFVYTVAVEGAFSPREAERLARAGMHPLPSGEPVWEPGSELLRARPVVVGTGPAGLFCALYLAEHGYRPLVLERGGDVEERVRSYAALQERRVLDPHTNIQFGAGGAGAFSDGKLVTRVNDPLGAYVLRTFVACGAPASILTQAKPHIGTDILRTVVSRLLGRITAAGGEVHFHTQLDGIEQAGGCITAVRAGQQVFPAGAVVLAIGHSARDTYAMLLEQGIAIVPKPFSVGVRIEHLQSAIDTALYGSFAGHPALGHAEYTLSDRSGARGVYTFCMCPGGTVVAATSECGGVVVNGMSEHARDGKNANAAVAVSVECADYGNTPQGAIAFQRGIEQAAFRCAGEDYSAPCCTVGDMLAGKEGTPPTTVQPTYLSGGVRCAAPDRYLPPFVCASLRASLPIFARHIEGYCAPQAVLTGPETRTSAPVRILREGESRLSPSVTNLYPCGEGAGYAGGITSAALDGLHTAEALCRRFHPLG